MYTCIHTCANLKNIGMDSIVTHFPLNISIISLHQEKGTSYQAEMQPCVSQGKNVKCENLESMKKAPIFFCHLISLQMKTWVVYFASTQNYKQEKPCSHCTVCHALTYI